MKQLICHTRFTVLRDFNIDVLNYGAISKRFGECLKSVDLNWLIDSSTRVTASSLTAIGNILSNIPDVEVCVVNIAIGDRCSQ